MLPVDGDVGTYTIRIKVSYYSNYITNTLFTFILDIYHCYYYFTYDITEISDYTYTLLDTTLNIDVANTDTCYVPITLVVQ
jgi:hypothetical protein